VSKSWLRLIKTGLAFGIGALQQPIQGAAQPHTIVCPEHLRTTRTGRAKKKIWRSLEIWFHDKSCAFLCHGIHGIHGIHSCAPDMIHIFVI
jgi:hypothetical protein